MLESARLWTLSGEHLWLLLNSSCRCRVVLQIDTDIITFWSETLSHSTIQYEAEINGVWHEIVRYDSAHGRPHKDLVYPDGTEMKEEFLHYTNAEVLTFGQNDIRKNWKEYRRRYEKDMRKRK